MYRIIKNKYLIGFIVFFLSFVIYLKTLSPTILWNDSAELITAAYTLGIPHPTGYPLFILLGKLFSFLPIGSIAFRLNIMSAFLCSLTLTTLFFILVKFTNNKIISIIGVFALAFSHTFWDQATFAEVYPLHLFLFSLLILVLLVWKERKNDYFLYLFSFLYGLSLTNHLLTLLMLPAALYFILIKEHKKCFKIKFEKRNYKIIIALILFFLIGLLPYLYLPIRSRQNPTIDWGDTEKPLNFFRHITGREFGFKMFNFSRIFEQIKIQSFNLFIKQFTVIFGLIGLIGIFILSKKNFRYFVFFMLLIVSYLFYTLSYNIGDIIYYYLPIYLVFTVFIALGLKFLYNIFKNRILWKSIFIILSCVLIFIPISLNWGITTKKSQYFAYDYAKKIYSNLENGALVFTNGDEDTFPLWYYTLAEYKSKNITIIDTFLLTKPWFLDQLKLKGIIISYNKSIPFYYKTEEEAKSVLKELINNIIEENIDNNPIYFTIYFFHEKQLNLSPQYFITPKDHVYKIENKKTDEIDLKLDYNGLFDKRVRKDEHTRIMLSNLCNYLGLYYLNKEEYNKSVEKFQQAVSIKPNSFVAHANLGYIYVMQKEYEKALAEYNKAYQIDPNNELIYDNIQFIKQLIR